MSIYSLIGKSTMLLLSNEITNKGHAKKIKDLPANF